MRYCTRCGNPFSGNENFCTKCGAAVDDIQSNKTMPGKPVKKKMRTDIIIAVITATCLTAASVGIGYMMYPTKNDTNVNALATAKPKKKEQASPSVSQSGATITEAPLSSNTEVPVSNINETAISNRTDLYNSALTYKRMSDIHTTVLTDDKTFNALKTVIEEFDAQCADYMNEITNDVPSYLKQGTTAYNQQVEYKQKHPTLNQSYQKIDVINARQGGGYYYVWVTEVMNINEHGAAKVTIDHWIYKIEKDNGNWYICDYTSDPAF